MFAVVARRGDQFVEDFAAVLLASCPITFAQLVQIGFRYLAGNHSRPSVFGERVSEFPACQISVTFSRDATIHFR